MLHELFSVEKIISHIHLDGYELSNEGYNIMKRIVKTGMKLIKEYELQREKRRKEQEKESGKKVGERGTGAVNS